MVVKTTIPIALNLLWLFLRVCNEGDDDDEAPVSTLEQEEELRNENTNKKLRDSTVFEEQPFKCRSLNIPAVGFHYNTVYSEDINHQEFVKELLQRH